MGQTDVRGSMKEWYKEHFITSWSDLKEGITILFSRAFWNDFKEYWSGEEVSKRIDNWLKEFKDG